MEQFNLTKNQLLTWQQAVTWANLPEPKYIMFGSFPATTQGKEFFKPFIKAGYIDPNHLKYTGAFRLTTKGIEKFKELINNPQLEF